MNTGLSLCRDEDFEMISQISGVDKNMLKRYFGYSEKLECASKVIAVRKLNRTQMPLSIKNEARHLAENKSLSAPKGKGEKEPLK